MTPEIIISSLFLVFLVLCSGYFSSSETALFSLSPAKIKAYQASADPRKRLVAKLVLEPKDLLVTVFMLNTLVNILIQNTASSMFGQAASWALKVGVPFVLMLIFGEIIPKYIGLQNNIKLANLFAPSINFLQNFLKPIRTLIVRVTAPISHVLFFYLNKEESISKDELKHVLKTSQEHGVLNPDEAELVLGYLNIQDTTVKELMHPREDILFFDINEPLSKLIYLFVDQECSRLPVCDKTIDNVLGIITAKEFFLHRSAITDSRQLLKYLQKPLYIPETTTGIMLLRLLRENQQILALAVDEYGSISGVITSEDVIEVIIGDISDLRDSKDLFVRPREDEIIASGKLELSEFNDIFRVDLQSENNMVTISGWLIEQLGDIPKSGSKFEIDNFLFQILAADPNKIRRLYIRRLKPNGIKK